MSFSTCHLRILISLSVMITLMAPLATISTNQLAMAEDAFGRDDRDRADRNAAFDATAAPNEEPVQLREGTLIPPTPGRIVLIGRRWAFVPASVEAARTAAVRLNANSPPASRVSFRAASRPTRLGGAMTRDISSAIVASEEASQVPDMRSLAAIGLDQQPPEVAKVQMLISENLMLQRVVEAIRIDPADDRWTVSGQVTEFFDHNRLIIRTAQRANTN